MASSNDVPIETLPSARFGQPFRFPNGDGVIYHSCNEWLVFYCRVGDQSRQLRQISRSKWDRVATSNEIWIQGTNDQTPISMKGIEPRMGMRVRHSTLGTGFVISHNGQSVEVSFTEHGRRVLSTKVEWPQMSPVVAVRAEGNFGVRGKGSQNASTIPGDPSISTIHLNPNEHQLSQDTRLRNKASEVRARISVRRPDAPVPVMPPGAPVGNRRACSCSGNENCFRCGGTGRLEENPSRILATRKKRSTKTPTNLPGKTQDAEVIGKRKCQYCNHSMSLRVIREHEVICVDRRRKLPRTHLKSGRRKKGRSKAKKPGM